MWFLYKQSTSHALIKLIEYNKKHIDQGHFVCGLFIDLHKHLL